MSNEAEIIYSWLFGATSTALRYFLIAGLGYFIFYVWKYKLFAEIKIQKEVPPNSKIQAELFYSSLTIIIYCGISLLIFYWKKTGLTKIYLDINQYGYFYFVVSILIMVFMHDAYFYWTHRFLHLPKIFKWIHKTHHLSHNPTPWATFAFHPLEALISIGIVPIIVFLIPSHPFALFAFLIYMTIISVMGHLGYELFSLKFRKSKIGKWQNTATDHNIHHQLSHYNYGLYFSFWDSLMHTYYSNDSK